MLAFRILLHPLDPPSVIPPFVYICLKDGLETENPLTCERIFRELASHSRTEDNRRKEGEALAERIICLAGGLIFIIRWDREETKRLSFAVGEKKGSRRKEREREELAN